MSFLSNAFLARVLKSCGAEKYKTEYSLFIISFAIQVGQGEGRETEANQITIRVNGTLYGGMTREQAEQAQKDTAAGKTVELPKQAV